MRDIIVDSALSRDEALAGKDIPDDILAMVELVTVDYLGFDNRPHRGQIIIHRDLKNEVRAIFASLFAARFPIEKVCPVSLYDWSDEDSMSDNNTSGFNYRNRVGMEELSWHAYGRAIDINPRLNPYVKEDLILPPGAMYFPAARGTIIDSEVVVRAFTSRGWQWGGHWTRLKDWQHFERHW